MLIFDRMMKIYILLTISVIATLLLVIKYGAPAYCAEDHGSRHTSSQGLGARSLLIQQ